MSVPSSSQQIQSKYYGGNMYVSIEGLALEHFNAPTQSNSVVSEKEVSHQTLFYSFLSDDNKQDDAINTAHSKHLLQLL